MTGRIEPQAAEPAASDTRSRLKIVARALIAERGVDAVGVREILQAAGARNASSLNYHFVSKEGLIRELVTDIFANANTRWTTRLEVADAQGRAGSVRELVDILIREAEFTTPADPNPTAVRFLASVLFTRRQTTSLVSHSTGVAAFNALLRRIAMAAPQIPPQTMRQRLIFFSWYLVSMMSAYEAGVVSRAGAADPVWLADDALQNLIDTSVAMFEAPVSQRPSAPPAPDPSRH